MSAIEDLAAALKERKGIGADATGNEPRAAAPVLDEAAPGGDTGKAAGRRRRRRYTPGRLHCLRLEQQLGEANRRTDKAESTLAELQAENAALLEKNRQVERLRADAECRAAEAETLLAEVGKVEKVNETVWRKNQEIARLRAALDRPAKPKPDPKPCRASQIVFRRLQSAWKRIEALEAENEQLREGKQRHGEWQAIRLGLQTLLLQHPQPGVVSLSAAGAAVGVHPTLVLKWLRGECRPKPAVQKRVAEWIKAKGERDAVDDSK
jgi:hypothetical protein